MTADLRGWVAAFDPTSGYIPTEEVNGVAISAGNRKGVHGLWPTHDSSRAVFILSGPGVRRTVLGDTSILDDTVKFFTDSGELKTPVNTKEIVDSKILASALAKMGKIQGAR